MNVTIQSQGIDMTRKLQRRIRAQLAVALRTFKHRVISVDVFVKDLNGPKGGPDKSVLIRTHLIGHVRVAVTVVDPNEYVAVAIAARSTKRRVKRAIRKLQRFERKSLRQLDYAATS